MTNKNIRKCLEALVNAFPNPTTELKYNNTFQLLIAVMLSAQSTDKGVNKATETLFNRISEPSHVIALGIDELKKHIQTIGLYHTKAKHIIETCDILINTHNSIVPETREALEALPGVGRKTANVILNTAFDHDTIAVDTHVFRVSNRTGIAKGSNVLSVEKELNKNIPKDLKKNAHHLLIFQGRYICKAKNPLCSQCHIEHICEKNLSK